MKKIRLRLGQAGGSSSRFIISRCGKDASVFVQAKSRGKYLPYGYYISVLTRTTMAPLIGKHRFVEVYVPETGDPDPEGCIFLRRERNDWWEIDFDTIIYLCGDSVCDVLGVSQLPEKMFLKFV